MWHMDSHSHARNVKTICAIVADLGCQLNTRWKVLDFGCGEGRTVEAFRQAGYDACGCDVVLREGPHNGSLRLIDSATGRLPFPDDSFDLVVSESVFEHVMDYPAALAELRRVSKRGGIGVHVFPARWSPREPHVFVPFAGVVRSRAWLAFWAFWGIRNQFQKRKGFREVADLNLDYLRDRTNYLREAEIREMFERYFEDVEFREDFFLRHSYGGARHIYPLTRAVPFLTFLYRNLRMRCVVTRKSL